MLTWGFIHPQMLSRVRFRESEASSVALGWPTQLHAAAVSGQRCVSALVGGIVASPANSSDKCLCHHLSLSLPIVRTLTSSTPQSGTLKRKCMHLIHVV